MQLSRFPDSGFGFTISECDLIVLESENSFVCNCDPHPTDLFLFAPLAKKRMYIIIVSVANIAKAKFNSKTTKNIKKYYTIISS